MPDWQPIETAPKGHITENVGCRTVSVWFRARVSKKYKAANPGEFIVRRRAWPHEDGWEDRDMTSFVPDFFDAWCSHLGWIPKAGSTLLSGAVEWQL